MYRPEDPGSRAVHNYELSRAGNPMGTIFQNVQLGVGTFCVSTPKNRIQNENKKITDKKPE